MTANSQKHPPAIWRLQRTGRLAFVGTFKWFLYVSCSFSILVFIYALYDIFCIRTLTDFDVGTLMVVGAGFPICMGLAMRHECRKKKPDQKRLRDLLQQVKTVNTSEDRSRVFVEMAVMKHSLQGKGNIPTRLLSSPELSDTPWPDAILLVPSSLHNLPTPRSVNVPFEPLRLGHDSVRCSAILREFALDSCPKSHKADDLLHALNRQRVYPASLANLMWMFGPITLLVFLGMHITKIIGAYFGPVGFGGGLLLMFFSSLCWLGYGAHLIPFKNQCWVLPGAIVLRSGSLFASTQKQAVFRRGQGTLWYDAKEELLYIPTAEKHIPHSCSSTDGVFALWGWLNTAPLPNGNTFQSIGLRS